MFFGAEEGGLFVVHEIVPHFGFFMATSSIFLFPHACKGLANSLPCD